MNSNRFVLVVLEYSYAFPDVPEDEGEESKMPI